MTTKLTKTLLRNAATRLWTGKDYFDERVGHNETYMCHAVYQEAPERGRCWNPEASETVKAFERLLSKHGVDTNGTLCHEGVHCNLNDRDVVQALRFDFLNLLAESL
jgi:hypothetical protein